LNSELLTENLIAVTKPITYSDAGVDIDAATRTTDKIKELARRTFTGERFPNRNLRGNV